MDEDIELTYDPEAFINAINKMSESFDNFTQGMQKKTDRTAKTSVQKTKVIGAAFGKLAIIGTGIVGVIALIRKGLSYIPELGMVMKTAGDIILKNLLWPLRMQLVPVLQRILNWVKDNRSRFVLWGTVIGDVFKMVMKVMKSVMQLVKAVTKGIEKAIRDTFQITTGNIIKTFNLLVFKITAIFMLVSAKLKPLYENIGDTLGDIIVLLVEFVKEFGKAFLGISEQLGTMEALNELFIQLSTLVENLTPAFKVLAKVIGATLGVALRGVLEVINALILGINTLTELMTGELKAGDILYRIAYGKEEEQGKRSKVKDAIIKPNGDIIETDPMDTIIATKNGVTRNENTTEKSVNINVAPITVNVTEGNARNAGASFGRGLQEQIRMGLLDSYVRSGAR